MMSRMSDGRYLLAGTVLLCCCLIPAMAQERPRTVRKEHDRRPGQNTVLSSDDVIRIRTRAVFIDALVNDKRTNEPVRDLAPENFSVLDNGKPRKLSYFSREGDSRRPLALLLFIDVWSFYGRSHLQSHDAMQRLASALTKLAPEDEVAIMTTWIAEGASPGTPLPECRMIEDFTRDRTKTARALFSVPELLRQQEEHLEQIAERRSRIADDLRLDIVWRLSDVADEVIPLGSRFPNSQFTVVGLIDDLFDLRKGEREEAVDRALRSGVTFNGLVFKKSLATKLFIGTLNKLFMGPRGLSVHAAEYLAEQTGGEVASVGRADDLAVGFERFINSLMARYNLGFTLEEGERGDGRRHWLEVKVNGQAPRGKERELIVKARRAYYLSEDK